ncbi:MAG: hypothetical protein KY455_03915 [Euryarchaeota archaeon]|nr:hypothetical protein [Euryarchaeota archaeon]
MSKAQVGCRPLLLVVFTMLLVSALPVADAQVPHAQHPIGISAEYDDSFVDPVTETRDVRFDVSAECPPLSVETQLHPHSLQFEIESDAPWARATLFPTVVYPVFSPDECLQGAKRSFRVTASIAFTAQTPAFEPVRFRFTAAMDTGDTAEHEFDLRAGFYERWQARFETNVVRAGPSEVVQVPLTIENHGNGAIQVHSGFNEESSNALVVALPGKQLIPSLVEGGETNKVTVTIQVRTPDDTGRQDQMIIDLGGSSAGDPSIQLSPLQGTVVIHTTTDGGQAGAMMEELPGLTPVMMFLVLFVGLALLGSSSLRPRGS